MRLSRMMQKQNFEALKQAMSDVQFWMKAGAIAYPDQIMTWSDVNAQLATEALLGREAVLAKGGVGVNALKPQDPNAKQVAPGALYFGKPSTFADHIRNGYSIVLRNLQQTYPPVACMCADLGRDLMADVQANVYASWSKESPFGTHWDEHDVLIVQLDGEKHWEVFEAELDFPVDHALHRKDQEPPTKLMSRITMKKGDALYVPRGFWHRVSTGDAPSLHITIGIRRFTALDLFDWLKSLGHGDIEFRKNLPTLSSYTDIESHVSYLLDRIKKLPPDNKAENLLRFLQPKIAGRSPISLPLLGGQYPSSLLEKARFRLDRWITVDEKLSTDEDTILTDGTKHWSLPAAVAKSLPTWSEQKSFSFAELRAVSIGIGLSDDDVFRIFSDMLDEGMIYADDQRFVEPTGKIF